MRILFINPVGHSNWDGVVEEYLEEAKNDNTQVDVVSLEKGPHHLEYHYYEALIGQELLNTIKAAERNGYDAAIIGCFYDPFLHEAREICQEMVITAPAESSMQIAAVLGNYFSIMVGRKKWIPKMERNVMEYGFGERLSSFRSLDMGVLDFHADEDFTRQRMIEEAKAAVEEDGAESIILGCTVQSGFYKELQDIIDVPVIDVVLASFKHAEYLVDLRNRFGWGTSKVGGYEGPPCREIKDWHLEEQFAMKGLWKE
ncbi:MAG: hydantoin racemase [Clostridia bacterium]|nr:hydantoin racemase [Clostridia bacterium]